MQVTIDLMSVLTGLLILAGVVLIIFVIIAIARLIQTLTKVNGMLDQVRDPVAATTKQLPDLVAKFDRISSHVEFIAGSANDTIPPVLEDVKTVTSTVRESVTNVSATVHDVSDGVHGFFSGSHDTASQMGSIVSIITTVADLVSRFVPSKPKTRKSRIFRKK